MFIGGSTWQPPLVNPYGPRNMTSGMTASAALACASSANVHNANNTLPNSEESPTLAMKKNFLLEHLLKETSSSDLKENDKEKHVMSDK